MARSTDNRAMFAVIGFSFLALALAFSARAVLGLVMPIVEQELGWSRSFTSGAAGLALLVMAVIAPIGGRFVDKQGARAILLIGLGTLAVGCFLVAVSSHPIAFLLAFSGVSAVGFGLVATHVVSTAVEQCVKSNQGLATGIAVSGSTGGQFIILPALALLIGAYDWRLSFVVLGVGSILAMFMIQVWFPSDRNREQRDEDVTSNHASVWSDLRKIAKLPAFQILFWSYFICGYTTTGVIETHFIPYSLICGFSPVLSASAYGVLSAVNLAGMILAGWLTDRMSRPLLLFLIYLVRGVTFVILLNVGASFETLILFAVLFGLADYSTVPATASLVATHIGRHVMGLAFGIISAGHQVGAAAGAYLGGVLFDLYADYGWVWWSSVWLAVFAGMLVIFLKDKPSDTARADQFVAGVS